MHKLNDLYSVTIKKQNMIKRSISIPESDFIWLKQFNNYNEEIRKAIAYYRMMVDESEEFIKDQSYD